MKLKALTRKVRPQGLPWSPLGCAWAVGAAVIPNSPSPRCFHTRQRAQIQSKKQWPHPGVATDRGTPPRPPAHPSVPASHAVWASLSHNCLGQEKLCFESLKETRSASLEPATQSSPCRSRLGLLDSLQCVIPADRSPPLVGLTPLSLSGLSSEDLRVTRALLSLG